MKRQIRLKAEVQNYEFKEYEMLAREQLYKIIYAGLQNPGPSFAASAANKPAAPFSTINMFNMLNNMYFKEIKMLSKVKLVLFGIALSAAPAISTAEIVWSGDFETGDFTQWHLAGEPKHPQLAGVPAYGRPVVPNPNDTAAAPSYYGDGSLLSLVTEPVRSGQYAAKFTVKNSANGLEKPGDAYDDSDNGNIGRRRSELNFHLVLFRDYGALAYLSESWLSVSHYLPSDWDSENGSSWGPSVFSIKSPKTNEISPTLTISATEDGWRVSHRWSNLDNPNSNDAVPWQYQMFYDAVYPESDNWADGVADFPDAEASRAALADLNKGGWTDWVMHIKWDGRGPSEGGTGFATIWKRAGSGSWIKVLAIKPKQTTRGGMTFEHGVGYKVPGSGFGPLAGMYMDKDQVWGLPANRVIYVDNVKVGDANTTFAEMSPDGSSPGQAADKPKPKPPVLFVP